MAAARGVAEAPKVADGLGVEGVVVVITVRVVDAPTVRVMVLVVAGVVVAVPACP